MEHEPSNCAYYSAGYCLKGLAGTRCELVGCAAYQEKPLTHPIPGYPFPTEEQHRDGTNKLKRLVLTWKDCKRIVEIADALTEYAEAGIIEPFLASEEEFYKEVLKRFKE